MRRLLQQTGLAEKRITCEEALLGGFLFAKCHHMTAGFVMVGEKLDALLRKASVQLQIERLHESRRLRRAGVSGKTGSRKLRRLLLPHAVFGQRGSQSEYFKVHQVSHSVL